MAVRPVANWGVPDRQDITCFIGEGAEEQVRSALLDEKALAERIFYEDLRGRIDELFSCLPKAEIRASYLDRNLLDSSSQPSRARTCRGGAGKKVPQRNWRNQGYRHSRRRQAILAR
jgi:hypothetical protein